MKTYFCYTDGACKKSEGSPGGWGVHIKCPDGATLERFGGALKTQSEAMELTAIFEALKLLPEECVATFFTDSRAAIDLCDVRREIWKKSDWRNATGANVALLRQIDAVLHDKRIAVAWKWLRGHGGNTGNERADALAAMGAREAKARLER